MREDSEIELVRRFQAGIDREESFREIFQRFHFAVQRFFLRRGFSEEDTLDLVQETFLQAFQTLDRYRGESRFETWLYSVALNVFRNQIRRITTQKRGATEVSLDSEAFESSNQTLDRGSERQGPLEEAISREQLQVLRDTLNKLPPQMRLCASLRYERGLKYDEIATVLNISIETVKAHLHQARRRLMAEIGEDRLL